MGWLEGRVALVTGASRGLGCRQAAQKHLVENGYAIIVNVSSTSALDALDNRGQANVASGPRA